MKYLSLKIFKNSQFLKTKIFTDDQISIGSSEGLSLSLPEISPWHLLIEKRHDVFCVLDLNSEMGTVVNGVAIKEETLLESGSVIKVGPYELQFFVGPPVSQKVGSKVPVEAPSQEPSVQTPKPVSVPERPKAPVEEPVVPVQKPVVQEASPAPVEEPVSQEPLSSPVADKKPAVPVKEAQQVPAQQPVVPESVPSSVPQPEISEKLDSFQEEDLNVIPIKKKKGFWNTYAPSSRIKNLDDEISPSIGHLIEVTLAWKDRILKTYYFSKSQNVHIGSDKKCEIYFPNMLNSPSYKLMSISGGAKIYVKGPVQGTLFQGKDKETRVTHPLNNDQSLVLKPYEVVKLNFNSFLTVYIRLTSKPAQPPLVGLLNLRLSEALALLFAFLLTGLLVFYGTLYAPAFLTQDVDFIEKDARVAQVVFEKLPPKKVEKKTVKYDLNKKETKKKTTKAPKIKKEVKKIVKKPAIKTPIKKTVKKVSTPKKGKQGKIAAVAPGKAKQKSKKIKVGSARPGGSLKTGKKGSSAKTQAPDPTKMSVLGVFGGGGSLNKLDQAASGPGGLTGLATEYTGYGGTAEEYEGQGIGTKTKELSSGGQGSAIVGISGIKTKGKGLGSAGTGTGGLGERGRLSMEFSTEDIDVSGEIDRDGILRVLRSNRSKFDRCYQVALNSNASIQGKLPMQWRISSSGKGQRASALKSSIKNPGLKNCVAGVLESLNFPAPPSGQIPEVKFSFNFTL